MYAALSGSEAAFGQATVQGVRLAAEEINNGGGVLGKKIRLIIEDDAGRAEEAASVVTKLITRDGVIGVIGENSSNQSLAGLPIASIIRPAKIATIEAKDAERLGSLAEKDRSAVTSYFSHLLAAVLG